MAKCATCNGTGYIDHVIFDKDGNRRVEHITCYACNGTGQR